MKIAFQIRQRGDRVPAALAVARGERHELEELGRYVVTIDATPSAAERQALLDAGFELLTEWSDSPVVGLLGFGNYVGERELLGARIVVQATKLGAEGVAGLLAAVSERVRELVYSAATPLGFRSGRIGRRDRRVTFHDFAQLRIEMLSRQVGRRLEDHFLVIAEQPTHALETTRVQLPLWRARRLDPAAIRSLYGPQQQYSVVEGGMLPAALTHATPEGTLAPSSIAEPRRSLSYDTPENRFVRFFLEWCLETASSFVTDPRLNESLRGDARAMAARLQEMLRTGFLSEVGTAFSERPTMALLRRPGYRDMFDLCRRLQEAPTLDDAEDLLDGKDVPRLYEYWCFDRVLRACEEHFGQVARTTTLRWDDRMVLVPNGAVVQVGPAQVTYNETFAKATGSYSIAFRPDITLRIGRAQVVFDAKYRLRKLDLSAADDDAEDLPEERITFQRADLDKMHSYRDALEVQAAIALYPGEEFHFFAASSRQHHLQLDEGLVLAGVGACPLRPDTSSDFTRLRALVARLATQGA